MDKGQKSAEKESTKRASTSSFISPVLTDVGSSQYDVFLSFRGSDTCKAFTDHLYHSLVKAGIVPVCVFRDDNSISIGEEFGSQILYVIARSKISIPIISENYASSKWCLHELIHIMDHKKSTSHMVLPIFYKVDPSDVRYQKGSFGEAFHSRKKHFDEKDIQEGRQALRAVSDLHGWESEKVANGDKEELVEKVVENILSKMRQDFQVDVTKHLVGIWDHVNKIRNWVDTPTSVARMIGIYGMGGIGKTTLAKVIYTQLSNDFVHRSFLADIREIAHRNNIPSLQKQLIKDVLQIECQVGDVDDGIDIIKSRFKGKKVLILLDDIDDKNQLDALAGDRNWFMPGSMIIVTTRNEAVLHQSKFEVDYKYELYGLDKVQALLLFNKHAFRMDHSPRDFEGISHDIISTMGGLPLALQCVGSFLYKKTNRKVWEDVRKQLKNQPHGDVKKILQISYDALEDEHKQIFLDIACFFIGEKSKFAMYMWEDCGFHPSQGIEELKSRCLIKIGDDGTFKMHDQLRDFGRSIVCQERLPERRSRLWDDEEASGVLMGGKVTYGPPSFFPLPRIFLYLIRSILVFYLWFGIELDMPFSTKNLHLPNLVVMQLSNSEITELWGGWSSIMLAKRLKVLDLTCCKYLSRTPNLSAFTKLEILILKHCDGLEQVDPSIGEVKSLIFLDLSDCGSLKELPGEVGELVKLKELILDSTGIIEIPTSIGSLRKLEKLSAHFCRSLREIPNSIGDLQNLQDLDISHSAIEKLPGAIGRLKKLQRLSLKFCYRLKGEILSEIGDLYSLEILDITSTRIFNLPKSIRNLSSLQHLSLWGCYELRLLPELPSGLTNLSVSCQSPTLSQLSCLIHLEELDLYKCTLLEYIPELPSRLLKLCVASCHKLILPKFEAFKYLEELSIKNCSSIKGLDLSILSCLKRLHAEDCYNLVEIQSHDNLEFLEEIVIDCCKSIERLILPELQCLKQLKANYCDNLEKIQGLGKAEFLEVLDISDCESIKRLPDLSCFVTLKELNINGCCNLRGVESLERFLFCRSIYITGCQSLEKLPNLSKFENLENFTMRYSLGVTEIPGVEESRSLTHIDITGCKSMEILPDLSRCDKLQSLVVRDCKKLAQLRGLEKLDLIYLDISGCNSLETIPKLPETCVFRNYERAQDEVPDGNIILQ
ncbi:disease resistance protein L6-like [Syzygium oleosum]|uniref:disease resistance protein L6-like n=1 Tax=Syzygium oleosum TaxID=219896 RepID=UPI0024B99514|nr:disease resistance protein L6-like [Syzygium oleosum]